jgi:hypothetical protein
MPPRSPQTPPLPQYLQQYLMVNALVVASHIKARHVAMGALLPHDAPQRALDAAVPFEVDARAVAVNGVARGGGCSASGGVADEMAGAQ